MNINTFIIIIIIILLCYYCFFNIENFENSEDLENNEYDTYRNDSDFSFNSNDNNYEGSKINNSNSNEKCVINKVLEGNKFVYTYDIVNNNTQYHDSSNQRTIQKGDLNDGKSFDTANCSANALKLGSCRKRAFECVDFKTKNDCSEYDMEWSDKTCNELLPTTIEYPVYTTNIM